MDLSRKLHTLPHFTTRDEVELTVSHNEYTRSATLGDLCEIIKLLSDEEKEIISDALKHDPNYDFSNELDVYEQESLIETNAPFRHVVGWFAVEMEEKLRENDHKPGWRNDEISDLLTQAREELKELAEAINKAEHWNSPGAWQKVIKEAADVANFCMMIADNASGK